MVFRYFLKISKEGVVLKQKDREHESKHHQNEERIKQLEAKNGAEQKQISELKIKIETLEGVIRTITESKK